MKTKSIIKRLLNLGIEEKDIIRDYRNQHSIYYKVTIGDNYIGWWHIEETGDAITLSILNEGKLEFFDTIAGMIDYAVGSGLVEKYKATKNAD